MNDAFMLACSESAWSGGAMQCRWCDAPLTGRQQRWCSAACADAASVQHWWSAASRAARRKRKACERCGSEDALQAHHVDRAHGRHSQCSCIHHASNIEVLCSSCHKAEHARQRARLRAPGFEDAQLCLTLHDPRDLARMR